MEILENYIPLSQQTQYEKMKTKFELVEGERNVLADNEAKLEEKVHQLTSQLEVERMASHNAIEQLEQEQCDKRQLQEDLNELQVSISRRDSYYSDTYSIFFWLGYVWLYKFHYTVEC